VGGGGLGEVVTCESSGYCSHHVYGSRELAVRCGVAHIGFTGSTN